MKATPRPVQVTALAAVLAVLAAPILCAQSLETRRAQKNFVENVLPEKQKELNEALGFELPVEFDYASMGDDARIYETIPGGALYYVVLALTEIGEDDLGKQALKEKVKTLRVVHTADQSSAGIAMDGETVVVTADASSSTSETTYTALKDFLLKNL